MPDEQVGLVKENYVWSVLLHRGATTEGIFLHMPPGSCDHDLFSMTWGPTIAALSYVFDKSLDESILQKAIAGFRYSFPHVASCRRLRVPGASSFSPCAHAFFMSLQEMCNDSSLLWLQ